MDEAIYDNVDGPVGNEQGAKVLLSVCLINKLLGIACYDELSNTIYSGAIGISADDVEFIFSNIKLMYGPTLFLVHPKVASNKSLLDLILAAIDGTENFYKFKVLKSSHWNETTALGTICNNLVIRAPSNANQGSNTFQSVASSVNIECPQVKQTLGAMLLFMQEMVFNMDEGKVTVAALRPLTINSYMRLDETSFQALQIFSEELHPNVIKSKGRNKEGFSLFGLFDRTNSMPGRNKLKDWMCKPFCDKNLILHRQKGVAFAVRDSNQDLIRNINHSLKHVHDLPRLLLRVKKVEATYADWCKLHSSIENGLKIIQVLVYFVQRVDPHRQQDDCDFISELVQLPSLANIEQVLQWLNQAIDFAESATQGTLYISDGYDQSLDEMRKVYDQLETFLVQAAHQLLDAVPLIQNVSVEYVAQIGYLVAVQESQIHLLQESIQDFQYVYQMDGVRYYKHPVVCAMDDNIGDIKSNMADQQRLLLLGLEDKLLDIESELQLFSSALSNLDAVLSLGQLALERNLVPPTISEDPVIIIKNGRHLLQELTVDNFVANDTYISPDHNIALITGPNNSGKSIYLKQVGLITYLAHIGSYVPCEAAVIGLTDQILTRIASVESVSTPESSFTLDLTQMNRILRCHTPRSLCLVDEFGKGTTPVDGIAILAATIRHFCQHRGNVVFALHFTEIFHPQILQPADMQHIKCFVMTTITSAVTNNNRNEDNAEEDDFFVDLAANHTVDYENVPLYKLEVGVATTSDGINCAKHAGIPADVLARAEQIKMSVESQQAVPRPTDNTQDLLSDPKVLQVLQCFLQTDDWLSPADEVAENLDALMAQLNA